MEQNSNEKFDVFVIGSGIAGQTVAMACAKAGLKTAIADKREFGGTCANRGCDPKKVLLGATEILERAEHLKNKGIQKAPKLRWGDLQKFKRKFTRSIPKKTEENLSAAGITLYHQSPKFLDTQTLSVEGKTVDADKIVIATGYEPRPLSFKGSKYLKNSDDFLNLKKLPKSIVFLGAGYVGMEFAHMAARAGCEVTVVDTSERALTPFDPDLVEQLTEYSKKMGIKFIFKAETKSVERLLKNYKLTYKKNGKSKIIKCRSVFNTSGRVPSIAKLDLEKGDVAFSDKGIQSNAFLQSISNDNVYACGDVSDHGLPLTPLSGREGYVVAENIIKGNRKQIDLDIIPSVVFTLPHLASVGHSEEEARSRYKNIIVNQASVSNWFNAKRINAPVYSYKVILNARNEEIVGAHLLGPNAAETINIFTMAIKAKMKADEFQATIFTYPSWSNDLKSMV
ncbi:dihydrolipoyl dehydrogenase family protein [Pareuzebyella sediminis]|uniref:dihydrolipoyl dehydrogenase family protein n=1 Tax=Pareuzebyella sediminis TaxID=2607998 RepID=UPI0011ED1573|nr:NAD(P)/FAD-dependent oxidoreductase [Pareuzebyella sediminis]